jgi:hypothetical protein
LAKSNRLSFESFQGGDILFDEVKKGKNNPKEFNLLYKFCHYQKGGDY